MKYEYTIPLVKDEYWWGGIVQDGIQMPYNADTKKYDLEKEQWGNQSVPFLVSNKGRYLWSEQPFRFYFEDQKLLVLAYEQVQLNENGQNLKTAYQNAAINCFTLDHRYPAKEMFTEPQYNTWIEMMYEPTQDKVINYAREITRHGMPPGVLMIDDNWQEDYGIWDFHPGRFPDPDSMVKELHEMGFQVMLWVCNFISPDSLTGRMLAEKEYLVKQRNGKPALAHWWNGYSFMLDVTNEDAVAWFKERLLYLEKEYGVDGFKFDSGDIEHFEDDFLCKQNINGAEYSKAWAEIGLEYPLNEYRTSWKMGGKPLAQRLSDKNHSWERKNGLGGLIPNGLAQGLTGHAFSCPDMIGGGEYMSFMENSDTLDMELIVRNAQCAALFPMMQFSVAPWRVLDETHLKYCVEMANLHSRMSNVICKLAENAAKTGEPIIRHMDYVFPGNGYEHIDGQFMLGDDILVAPILEKGKTSKVITFPDGEWNGDDGSLVVGPCIQVVDAPLERLPWYQRTIISN